MLDDLELVFEVSVSLGLAFLVQNELLLLVSLPIGWQVVPVLLEVVRDLLLLLYPLAFSHVAHKRRLLVDLVILVYRLRLELVAFLEFLLHLTLLRPYPVSGLTQRRIPVRCLLKR